MRKRRSVASTILAPILCVTMSISTAFANAAHDQPMKVLVMGGSAAIGRGDTHNVGGFINRAFQILIKSGGSFLILNGSRTGLTVPDGEPKLKVYVNQFHPNAVILAYGLLNDASAGISDAELVDSLKGQILYARSHGSQVFVVTSVVTQSDGDKFQRFTDDERRVVSTLGDPSVHLIDVNKQMKTYIDQHKIDIQSISTDAWHPNTQGDQLAANLLAKDLSPYFDKNMSSHHSPS